jgi:hypothetical protein
LTATSARLNSEIGQLEKEVAANQDALAKATSIREKELAEFNDEEKNMLASISSLGAAITMLSKHQAGSFVQVASVIQQTMLLHESALKGLLTPSDRKAVTSFVQAPMDYFDKTSQPGGGNSYAPQSGQIFGILTQMKETFENDLSAEQKQELASQKAYEELKAAKEKEIAAGQAQVKTKSEELADTDEKKCASQAGH